MPVLEPRSGVPWIRFDRNELAGACGDLGTSLPLLAGLALTAGFPAGGLLFTFGLMQLLSGLRYGMPMSTQPLKAVAALALASQLPASVVWGAGLVIGCAMLLLQLLGLIAWLGRRIPALVIRGVQLGLAVKLATVALGTFIPAEGWLGLGLAAASVALLVAMRRQTVVPPALALLAFGVAFALGKDWTLLSALARPHFVWPAMARIELRDLWQGFVVLALPQLPLSLANSIFATEKTARDLFPHRPVTAGSLALTYSAMNLLVPLTGGVPVCHGAGGIAGHYAFGARTGGSVVLAGVAFLGAGLLFSDGFGRLVHLLPLPTLGVLLAFEALTMAKLAADVPRTAESTIFVLALGLLAAFAPYGFGFALVVGTLVHELLQRRKCDALRG